VVLDKGGVMKKSLLGLMLGIAFLFGNVQEASAVKGMQLKEICDWKNNPRRISKLPCLLFIQGVVYGFDMGMLTESNNDRNAIKKNMCIPKDKNQWTTIVKKYLEDHPEKLHEQGASLVISSLATAFPSCYKELDKALGLNNKPLTYSQDGSIRQSPDGKFRCVGFPKVRSLPECEKKFKEAKERTERLFHPEDHDTRFPSR